VSKTFERMPGEPSLWYSRFHAYLLAGSGRTVYSVFHGEKMGNKAEPPEGKRKAPGRWYGVAKQWEWDARAAEYDKDQQVKLRQAHLVATRKMNERHQQVATTAFLSLAKGIASVKWENLTPEKYVACLEKIIHLQRLIMGAPIAIELTGPTLEGGVRTQEMREALDAGVADTAKLTPEFFAQVMDIMERHGAPVTQDDQPAEDGTGPAMLAVSETTAALTPSEGVPIC
jgi:hypothetical protein